MGKHRNSLQPGYRLHWYLIKKILGQGGFGITYLAEDTNLNRLVAIKEYLPVELAVRDGDASIQPLSGEHGEQFTWGLDRFMSEAQTLAKFKHPNIVRVLAVFPENNTAYMVMEFEHGRGMHETLKEKETLEEEELNKILLPILDGLEAVHAANFIHRDIKPPNIYIREDGNPVLLDFGSARQSLGEQTRTLTTMVSPGYAPFEQYVSKSDKQGPWTDIYGLGATLYRSVTGIAPSGSMDRSEAILHTEKDIYVPALEIARGKYSDQFLKAIDHALAFKPEHRPQTIADWRQDFAGQSLPSDEQIEIVGPTVTNDVTESEVETVAVSAKDIQVEQEAKLSFFNRLLDKLYRVVKKLLKWGAILLVVLIILGILTDGDKKKEKQATEEDQSGPLLEQTADEPTATIEPVTDTKDESIDEEAEKIKKIEQLLAGAEQNLKELRLTTPAGNNAVEKYRSVLALDPHNIDAMNGIDRVVDEYIELMDRALIDNNIPAAHNYLHKGEHVNPEHSGLPAAKQRLDNAVERNRTKAISPEADTVPTVDTIPEPVIEKDQSLVPKSERQAIKETRDRVIQNPDDSQARREMRRLAKKVEGKIKEAIKNKDYELAEDYVNEILQYAKEDSKKKKELHELLKKIQIKKMQDVP
jgi:serine/threonine protein kinase